MSHFGLKTKGSETLSLVSVSYKNFGLALSYMKILGRSRLV